MKITKVFAGLLAMAVVATTAISASAASTISVNNPDPQDWGAAFPKWTVEGGSDEMDDYIDAKTFTKGTEMTVKVTYEYTSTFTEEEEGSRYAILKPCHAAQGWKSLMDEGYVSGLVEKGDWDYAESGIGYTKKDGSGDVPYVSQGSDILTNDPNNTTIEFTISADGVDAMIAAATASDDAYDGLQIQEYGLNVKSIELSQDGVQLSSQYSGGESKGDVSTDSTAGSEDNKPGSTSTDTTKTSTTGTSGSTGSTGKSGSTSTGKSGGTSSSDSTANTGATAGLALAGLALAGAAFVVSKKK